MMPSDAYATQRKVEPPSIPNPSQTTMADQKYKPKDRRFWLDLHNVTSGDAEKAIKSRLNECVRYGV